MLRGAFGVRCSASSMRWACLRTGELFPDRSTLHSAHLAGTFSELPNRDSHGLLIRLPPLGVWPSRPGRYFESARLEYTATSVPEWADASFFAQSQGRSGLGLFRDFSRGRLSPRPAWRSRAYSTWPGHAGSKFSGWVQSPIWKRSATSRLILILVGTRAACTLSS